MAAQPGKGGGGGGGGAPGGGGGGGGPCGKDEEPGTDCIVDMPAGTVPNYTR